ncbi:glycosyltransferase family 2 protein [Flavobacterium sp.]|uniref:glycosyltransferase family 2 protein n=1 Tax=Flavobacterium sp. TaxID=239 RepID=UPI000EC2D87C|nr:glycosyltransferase family 2 protein [Flavobacterium sp.]HCQ11991.1 hypothetical protein [Flavobacterium sp.]
MENKATLSNLKNTNSPLVSVCMITYGHEKYIEEAINSVLMQECNFEFELIISNDCSPDKTDFVIQTILKTHPKAHCIKYFNQQKNLGMMPNSIFVLEKSQGDYIAVCEGDDFWTDKLKLQKQVDFFKKNKQCSLCFHNATIYDEFTNQSKMFVQEYHKKFYTGTDILERWLIPSASMMFVNVLKEKKLPHFFATAMHGDLALQLILFEYGTFGLINENMCTYRLNESSATRTLFYKLEYKYAHIAQLKEMKTYFKGKYNRFFDQSIINQYRNIISHYKTTYLRRQSFILLKMMTFELLAIKKYHKEIWESFKIFIHNVLDRVNGRTT